MKLSHLLACLKTYQGALTHTGVDPEVVVLLAGDGRRELTNLRVAFPMVKVRLGEEPRLPILVSEMPDTEVCFPPGLMTPGHGLTIETQVLTPLANCPDCHGTGGRWGS